MQLSSEFLFGAVSKKGRLKTLMKLVEQSGFFDRDWYLQRNLDVLKSGVDPLQHFCIHGDREQRSPGPNFDSDAYAEASGDLSSSSMGALEHYLKVGRAAGRTAPSLAKDFVKKIEFRWNVYKSGLFDQDWYRNQYSDLRDPDIDLLSHFAFHGVKERRDPGPNFSSTLYTLAYSEHISTDESPFEHYLLRGREKGLELLAKSKYEVWLDIFDSIDAEDRDLMRSAAADTGFPDLQIVHVFDSLACRDVDRIFDSLKNQVFERWTAWIVFADDVSERDIATVVARATVDPRIRANPRPLEDFPQSTNNYVLLIHGCVRLTPHATFLFIERALSMRADFVYSDYDRWTREGKRCDPVFNPVFSPEFLRNRFYVGSCVLAHITPERRDLVTQVMKDFRHYGCDQLSNALLAAPRGSIAHVPFVLYSLLNESAGLKHRLPLVVAAKKEPSVSIVVATRDRIELLRDCLESIESVTQYPRDRLEIVIVDNGSETSEARSYFAEIRERAGYKVVSDPGDFNFSRLYNLGASRSSGDILVLINNDMTVIEPRWIKLIADQCVQPDVGAVGAKLLYPDGTIQHAGCNIGVSGLAAHRNVGKKPEDKSAADTTREMAAVTGACLGIRRDVFELVEGLDETLRTAFNDTKLCLSCLELGFRNIYISEPLLYHYEFKSRGADDTQKKIELRDREAIYTRQSFPTLFQEDPYYSPNLSIEKIDELAFPPRSIKPWRSLSKKRPPRIMFLSSTLAIGHGVPLIIQMQAKRLIKEGFEVIVAGPLSQNEFAFDGCRRIIVSTVMMAACVARREYVDCVFVHTPPFYSITRYLGSSPIVYFSDAGEPNPELFNDRAAREAVNWEKRFCAPLAKRIFAISQAIKEQSLYKNVSVLRLGNSHMANWSSSWNKARSEMRAKLGWQEKFVVLNVCRFSQEERRYKGVDKYLEVMEEISFSHPDVIGKIVFVLAGKANPSDISEMESRGLSVFPNVSDQLMTELYAASDIYVNFSKWEGYNLGIAQALAMGLPVIASDIEAHREFPIVTTNNVRVAIQKLYEVFVSVAQCKIEREAMIFDWDEPVAELVRQIQADLNQEPTRPLHKPSTPGNFIRNLALSHGGLERPEGVLWNHLRDAYERGLSKFKHSVDTWRDSRQ